MRRILLHVAAMMGMLLVMTVTCSAYYDPTIGRFLSPDPLGHEASMDLYSYANGDPINECDPDGRFGKSALFGQQNDSWASYLGAAVGRTMPGFQTSQQVSGMVNNYVGNLQAFDSHYIALNYTLNPAYEMWFSGDELFNGVGMHWNNLGQNLSTLERANAGGQSVVGAVSLAATAYGGARLTTTVAGRLRLPSRMITPSQVEGIAPPPVLSNIPKPMPIFRVVNNAERAGIESSGKFTMPAKGGSTPTGQPGKFFWGSLDEAKQFEQFWYRGGEESHILQTTIGPEARPWLGPAYTDGIGQSIFVELPDLTAPIQWVQ